MSSTIGGGTRIAFDADGNRYIADRHLGLVRKLSNGTIATFPVSPPLALPGDPVRADSSGNIYDAINFFGTHLWESQSTLPATSTPPMASTS